MWWWRARQHKYTICGSNFIIARGTTSWLPISLQCPLPGQFIFIKNVEAQSRKNLLYSVFRWGEGDNRRRLVHLSWLSRTFIHWPATVVDWGKAAKHSVIANRRRWLTSVDSEHWKARPPPTTDYRLTLPIKWTARLASLMQFHRVNLLWRCTLLSSPTDPPLRGQRLNFYCASSASQVHGPWLCLGWKAAGGFIRY